MSDIDVARLAWLQLQDSAFPAGRFVHSNGLEAWLAAHPQADEDDIASLVRTYVENSVATLDAVLLAHAWLCESVTELRTRDGLLTTYKLTISSRTASERSGGNLARVARTIIPTDELGIVVTTHLTGVDDRRSPGHQAVVKGALQRALGISRLNTVAGFLRSTSAGMFSAAVRLGRLGALAAQRIQLAERTAMVGLARNAETTGLDDLSVTAPELETFAMRHESATARLFTT